MKPMLAKPFHPRHLLESSVLLPKLNGLRLVWTGSTLLSRRGKPVEGVPHIAKALKKDFKSFALDGELFVDPSILDFNELVGKVRRSKNLDIDERIQFWVFDRPVPRFTFAERYDQLSEVDGHAFIRRVVSRKPGKEMLKDLNDWRIKPKDAQKNFSELESTWNVYGDKFEGTMVRTPGSMYQFGKRSSDLLKLKAFKDSEFKIVDFVELESHEKVPVAPGTPGAHERTSGEWVKNGKATPMGSLGAFVCAVPGSEETFEVGTGMTQTMRDAFWKKRKSLKGEKITVKYQELHPSGKPQFPVFVEIRDYE